MERRGGGGGCKVYNVNIFSFYLKGITVSVREEALAGDGLVRACMWRTCESSCLQLWLLS